MLIADAPRVGDERVLAQTAQALAGAPYGSVLVIDRDQAGRVSDRERLARLTAHVRQARPHGALVAAHGRPDLALAAGAQGVQLPERGLPADVVRATFPSLLVGRSCHDRAGLEAAARAGASWALVSPVAAPVSGKEASQAPLGVAGAAELTAGLGLRCFALGGVTPSLAGALCLTGLAGVATLGYVLLAAAPEEAARALALACGAARGSKQFDKGTDSTENSRET